MYGFSQIKTKSGREEGGSFRHDLFARDSPEMCTLITRARAKKIREETIRKQDKEEENNSDNDAAVPTKAGGTESSPVSNRQNQEAGKLYEAHQSAMMQYDSLNLDDSTSDDDNGGGGGGCSLQNKSINQGKSEESPLYSASGNNSNATEPAQNLSYSTNVLNNVHDTSYLTTSWLWAQSTANNSIPQMNTFDSMGMGLRYDNNGNNGASQPLLENPPTQLQRQKTSESSTKVENMFQKQDVLDNDATSIGTIDIDWDVSSDCIIDQNNSMSNVSSSGGSFHFSR